MLKAGDKAPDFMLQDSNFVPHNISDYYGQWLLLYFYPKDFTSGCTTEACSLRDNFEKLKQMVQVVGVSGDSVESHKKFIEKYSLPFTLLADPNKKTISDYGANGIIFAKRVSFLINPKGVIEKVYNKVDPKVHASQILQDFRNFK
jgi:thioredoxin-dependent peroxiredoxin